MKALYKRESHYYYPHRKTSKLILLLLISSQIFFVIKNDCIGQQSITWQRLYNGPGNYRDYGWDVCASSNGNYFLLGGNVANGAAYILKINPYGDTLWTLLLDTISSGKYAGVSSGDGGCILASDNTTTKIDSSGNIIWHKRYGQVDFAQIRHVIKTNDGSYLACGRLSFDMYAYAFKTDSLGNLIWQNTYPSGEFKAFTSATEAWDGGYIFVGAVSQALNDTTKSLIMKTDINGNVIWEKSYKIDNGASTFWAINKIDGGYIVSGKRRIVGVDYSDRIFFSKINLNGDTTFTKVFFSTRPEFFGDMKIINNNRYVIGLMRDSSMYIFNSKVIITDSIGSIVRENIFPEFGSTVFFYIERILHLPDGDLIYVGHGDTTTSSNNQDIWAMRTDSNLYAPPIGIRKNSSTIPQISRLHTNFPNPFNSSTTIRFDISKTGNVLIEVYDILGRNVFTLVKEYLNAGEYSINWNANNLSSGVYFCKMFHNSIMTSTQKIIFIK